MSADPLIRRRAAAGDAERLTAMVRESGAHQGSYASILAGHRATPACPTRGFHRRTGAQRVGAIAPSPPAVTWERPDLWFALS
ncbi:hypothetical protein ACFYNL_29900 [Streptomyces sp. NPDC007808]|uniref:hypothetical protein n=1 Tax=Streptomyces sp. NPDC007808 TaxID=3364779 RepID=UPI003686DD3E